LVWWGKNSGKEGPLSLDFGWTVVSEASSSNRSREGY
jgi:hypothetical protein